MAPFSRENLPEEEVFIRPTKGKRDPEISGDALMVLVRSELDRILASGKVSSVERWDMFHFNLYRIEYQERAPLIVFGPFTGAPQAVMGLEKVVALGARRIWVMGWCGSLQPDLRIGDLMLPTRGLSEEGTSLHYPIGDNSPAPCLELVTRLEKLLHSRGYSYRKGGIWSTDAPFRETKQKVEAYRRQGVLAVDMEMAALMTVAIYRQVDLCALLVVSDELSGKDWNPGFSTSRFREASERVGVLMLEFLCQQ
ncbi:MAG: nucleoside phosphorylase [Deltaproteobacteria bacterium]|nr:nucleoside phosphorylase [Deltaproteobacteria bacterium]